MEMMDHLIHMAEVRPGNDGEAALWAEREIGALRAMNAQLHKSLAVSLELMPPTFAALDRERDARIEEVLHLRATVREARNWLVACLGMVDGQGPPNWDGIREFLKSTE